MRQTLVVIGAVALGILGSAVHASAQTSSISGIVVDDSGIPLANATVLYKSVPPGARPLIRSGVKTTQDGSFAITSLPAALYSLCAYGTLPTHLGSCEWTQGAVLTSATTSVASPTVKLVVARGALITLQVLDPNGRIVDLMDSAKSGAPLPVMGSNFRVGLISGSRFTRAPLTTTQTGVRQYQVAVPKTFSPSLFLDTSLNVTNDTDMPVPIRQIGPTISPGGQEQATFTFKIP